MAKLWELDAVEARTAMLRGEISPVDLVEASIARIEAVDPVINAVVIPTFESARAAAAASEARYSAGEPIGALEGLPVLVKDLNHIAGVRTTYGSPLYRDFLPGQDDDVVASLKRAGAVILGKSNVPEHGFGATTTNPLFGSTGNPFDPALSAGASTGGGAAGVGACMAPLATGSDFAGSLRTPASFCGIAGLRPSVGVVGTARRALGWSPFDVEGPMARSAADLKLLLGAMAKDEADDPLSRPTDPALNEPARLVDLGGLRVALSEDLGFAPMSRVYRAAFRAKLARFAGLFGSVDDAHPDLGDADRTFYILRGLGFVTDFGPMREEFGERLGPVVLDELARAERLTLVDYGRASQEHTALVRRTNRFFRDFDILITPAASVPPFPHADDHPAEIDGEPMGGYLRWEAISYGITLTGCPAAVIPAGLGPGAMPFGLQLVAARGRDAFLLDVAHSLEHAFAADADLARPRPADLSRKS
jgi:Asp-tRNA(Asn)/Glu-tRNA(Gln) amidotransferase A subunit family amidase